MTRETTLTDERSNSSIHTILTDIGQQLNDRDAIVKLEQEINSILEQNDSLKTEIKLVKASEKFYSDKLYQQERLTQELKSAIKHLSAFLATE